jgi:hypothetical protein
MLEGGAVAAGVRAFESNRYRANGCAQSEAKLGGAGFRS